jgi:hypothetical protein
LGLASFLHPFSLSVFPPFSLPFILSLLFVPFVFIYYFPISSSFSFPHFFVFCYFIWVLLCPSVLLRHFSSPPSLPWFSTEKLHPLSEFQCYWIVYCSHVLPPLDFLLSFIPQYYVFWSLSSAHGIFSMQ